MKPDTYTKAVLTVIAIMLTLIACNRYIDPKTTGLAQGVFAGVQFSGMGTGARFFDTRTGEVWNYDEKGNASLVFKISRLGGQAAQAWGYR